MKKDRHKHPILALRLPPEYKAAILASCEESGRNITKEVGHALRVYLQPRGFWPPVKPGKSPPSAN